MHYVCYVKQRSDGNCDCSNETKQIQNGLGFELLVKIVDLAIQIHIYMYGKNTFSLGFSNVHILMPEMRKYLKVYEIFRKDKKQLLSLCIIEAGFMNTAIDR